jgi:hypothetical protein
MNNQSSPPPHLTKLLSSWLNVGLLFVAGQAVFSYGALAGFLFTGAFFTAFILMLPLIWLYPRRVFPEAILIRFVRIVGFIETSTIHLFILLLFITAKMDYSSFLFLSLTGLVFGMFIFISIWRKKADLLVFVKLTFLLAAAVFLPNYVYLQKGLETAYYNLLNYYPKFLHLEQEGTFLLFFLLMVTFFSKMFIEIPNLQNYVNSKFWPGIRKLLLGIFIWGTVILAFSTMTLVSITYTSATVHINTLFFAIFEKQSQSVLVIAIFSGLFICTFIELFNAQNLIKEEKRSVRMILSGISVVLATTLFVQMVPVLKIFLLFGLAGAFLCLLFLLKALVLHLNIKTVKMNINKKF